MPQTPWNDSYQLHGNIAQTIELSLDEGQSMWASKGALICYDDSIEWSLEIPGNSLSRMLSGEGLTMTRVTAKRSGAKVVLGANDTGKIAAWDLSWGPVTCTPGAFLAAVGGVQIDVTAARRAGAAFFGGAGLLLQKISGRGLVFIHGKGDFIQRDLAAGERLLVSTGNLAAYGSEVDYGVVGVGGLFKMLFAREGVFMTQLTGPGRVLLQTLKRVHV